MRGHPLVALWLSATPTLVTADEVTAKVDAVFAEYDKPGSPGCALAVIRDGAIVYGRGYGLANLEHGVPIGTRTVFDIGSTSKQFTAASVLLLAQQGKLSIDDDARTLVPEMPAYGKPVTIRHLMNHTSGVRDYLELMELAGWRFDDVSTDEDALALIVRQKGLNFEPGSEYLYSNSGFFLLSVIVKRASGKPLREFAQESIFEPLGMSSTHFHDDHTEIVPGRATGYSPRKGGGFQIEMSNFEQTGDGSVYTTVEDLLSWDRNFYEPRVGGRELVEQITVPGKLTSGKALDYASGLIVRDYKGLKLVSHGGSWAGYRAELIRFPEKRFSVACLCNLATTDPSRLARRVADVYLAADLRGEAKPAARPSPAPAPVALTLRELEEKAGLYRDPKTASLRRVSVVNGKLTVEAFGRSFELQPVSKTVFRVADAPVDVEMAFEPRKGGGPGRMKETVAGRDEPVVREAVVPPSLAAAELAEYAGTYYSEELQTTYTLVAAEGGLSLRGKNLPKDPLLATVPDEFNLSGVVYRFARDPRGRVSGFTLDWGRIRGVRFERYSDSHTASSRTPGRFEATP